MKKVLFFIAAVACMAMTACTKTVRYGYDGNSLTCAKGYESEVQAFIGECQDAASMFDGIEFTESEFVSAFERVVNKYDHKHIQGPFKLWKNKQSNVIKTFNMTLGEDKTSVPELKKVEW